MEAIINYLDKYTTQIVILQIGALLVLLAVIAWVYFYNRKKYNHLKHQIPASVVKNYLDSIIQNSTALKSSLFRGGGLDVDTTAVPSVMPIAGLERAASIDVDGSGDEALKAEIASLRSKVLAKQDIITGLEEKVEGLNGVVKEKSERIIELEKLLKEQEGSAPSGDNSELEKNLVDVTKERDQLKEELAQYAIIQDDLADLKKLRQENEQLKKSIESSAPAVATAEVAPAAKEVVNEKVAIDGSTIDQELVEEIVASVEEPKVEAPEPEKAAIDQDSIDEMMTAASAETTPETEAEEVSSNEEDKSPEDLLSEFEKMLG